MSSPVPVPDDSSRPLEHLVRALWREYQPETSMPAVVSAVHEARRALQLVQLDDEEDLTVIETVARQELDMLTGRRADTARVFGINRPTRGVRLAEG